jgi:MipA family protein
MSIHFTSSSNSNSNSLHYASAAAKILLVTSLCWVAGAAFSQVAEKKLASPWKISAGLGLVSLPEYEGARKRITSLTPDLNATYTTDGWGTFGIGSKSNGISWTIVDTQTYSFGLSLGAVQGRVDSKDGTLFKPGSKRLRGMGEIKSTAEYGVFGRVNAGVPLTFAFKKDSGNGKLNAADGSLDGSGGSVIELGAEIPWAINSNLALSLSPNVVWADKKHNQTYFGVTAAQSAKTGFKMYTPSAGIKSMGVTLGGNYKIDNNWSVNTALSLNLLRGDAGKSSIVQKKDQSLLFVGTSYTF